MFKKNEGKLDRIVRAILALILFLVAWYIISGILKTILFVLAFVFIFTAVSGFCGLYKLLGINTCKVKKE